MGIFDTIDESKRITKDDLINDSWNPDKLGRVWTKRIQVINADDSFAVYMYMRYIYKNPHTKQKFTLQIVNDPLLRGEYPYTYKNIRTIQDLNITIHSIASQIISGPYHIREYRKRNDYMTWEDYNKEVENLTANK